MKKLVLGIVLGCLVAFAAPAMAEDVAPASPSTVSKPTPAPTPKPKAKKKAKKKVKTPTPVPTPVAK